jgi:Uma2 family endonuclease
MGLPKFKTKMSGEDYLRSEIVSKFRREYVFGETYQIPQNNINHNRICRNISVILSNYFLDSVYEAFLYNLKVQINPNVIYYPDILVSSEQNPKSHYFRNNPTLIIEVISKLTERLDRMEKVFAYKQILSLQEYAVIDQYRMEVQVHRRQENENWMTYLFDELDDIVEFKSVDLTIPLPEIYRRVTFEPNADRDEY